MATPFTSVAINYGREGEQFLTSVTTSMAGKYLEEGYFPAGSMGPKVEAFEADEVIGYSTVSVWIDVGMELVWDSEDVHYPDTVTFSIQNYNTGSLVNLNRIEWHGPQGVQFNPAASTSSPDFSTQVSFPRPALYEISADAYDDTYGFIGRKTVWVAVNPQQVGVTITASPDTTIWPDNRVYLAASITGEVPGYLP